MTEEIITLLPDVSADGKRNAFHHHCEVVGHYRSFAVCSHLCGMRKLGRLAESYADCSVAISKKRCPALSMITEEKAAGKAIYFIERIRDMTETIVTRTREFMRPSKAPHVKSFPSTEVRKLVGPRKSSVIDTIDTGGYADAINAMKFATKPGESPLALARRMMVTK